MIHHLQLQIGDWKSFFFINDDSLDASCEVYRRLRYALRCAGIHYPCRLKRVSDNDVDAITSNREKYPEVSDAINAYCDTQVHDGEWDEYEDEDNPDFGDQNDNPIN